MIIDFGHGLYAEPDSGPRDTPFHKRIAKNAPIPNTRAGHKVVLECGHMAYVFGNMEQTNGVILCVECRDLGEQK